MKHILIVDDDVHISAMLRELLEREGYAVSRAYSGTEALLLLSRERPDLILLDLMLPGLSGEELLPKIQGIPVIVLSAKADPDSKIALLLGGAADYVTKPFHTGELLAQISVRLRPAEIPDPRLCCGSLRLDADTRTAAFGEREVHLTRTECAILKPLLQNPGQVIPRTRLLERISEDTPDCTEGSLKMHISNLRKKLRDISGKDWIEAVWGIGFRLREE